MKQVNGKDLICNGSINKTLTLEELLQFDIEHKHTAIRYLGTAGEYAHSFEEIDGNVFTALPPLYEYQQIQEFNNEQANEALTIVYNRLNEHHELMKQKSHALHIELGKKIHGAQSELKFTGEFNLTFGQALGFVSAAGNWNDFKVSKVHHLLKKLHDRAPRVNFGVNNPNTGRIWHTWSIKSDYILMNFGYTDERGVKILEEWFKTVKYLQNLANVDSFKLNIESYENDGFEVSLVMWWD